MIRATSVMGTLALLLFSCDAAFATTFSGTAYEGFDYPLGPIDGESGGTGFNGSAWTGSSGTPPPTVVSGSLSYPGLTSTGNSLDVVGSSSNAVSYRGLGQTVDSGTFYFSWLFELTAQTTRTLNVAFFQAGYENLTVGIFGGTNVNSNGDVALVVNNGPQGTGTLVSSSSPIAVVPGTTYLVIGRVDFNVNGSNDDRIRLYVDPSSLTQEPSSAYIDTSNFDIGGVDTFRPFAGRQISTLPASSGVFDEVRCGTNYTVSQVPEPSGYGITGLVCFGLLRALRRRNALKE
jgi:hypothetical protein